MVSFLEKELGTYVSLTCRKKKKEEEKGRKQARRSTGLFLNSRWGTQRPPVSPVDEALMATFEGGRKGEARTGKLLL